VRRRHAWIPALGAALVAAGAARSAPPAVGLSTAAPTAAATARPILRLGSEGAAVRLLQQRLRIAVDGKFGPRTRVAVVALQRTKRLQADGVVGPRTWQALDGGAPTPISSTTPSSSGRPTIQLGSRGPAVVEAQKLLTVAGYRTSADGQFGPGTRTAATAFQRFRGLTTDGVIGPSTWHALTSTAPVSIQLISSNQAEPFRTIGHKTHTVRSGDTLPSVARATKSTPAALAAANRLNPASRLNVGSKLNVPGDWRCVVPGASFINDYGFARAGHLHAGNDLFAMRGTPVIAPVRGRVEHREGGLGGKAVNFHGADGHRYYFAHLDRFGATGTVSAGAVIGYVGNTGNAVTTLPHLHFEIHPGGGAAINPFPTITLACKR
jgi:peptidoglycan hydrolase-like protein with peptidoglycan-binding domain